MLSKYEHAIVIVLLTLLAHASYLDTNNKSVLPITDFITSPLGLYRLRLLTNCSLELQAYNEAANQYQVSSTLNGGLGSNSACTYLNLSLLAQSLLDSNGRLFKRSATLQKYNQLRVKVNDVGTVSLLSFYQGPDNHMQYAVDYFQNGNQGKEGRFLYNLQNGVTYRNKNNWEFTNSQGVISVRKADTNGTAYRIADLQGYQLTETGLMDPQGEIRYANFPEMSMKPKATPNCNANKGVFIQFDDYWPVMRIYDEDKHLLASYSIGQASRIPCPERTFEYMGECRLTCPSPLYKQMNANFGNCVINCEDGYVVDQRLKTCMPPNQNPVLQHNLNKILNRRCPDGSTEYEYGCYCSNGKSYDFENNVCVDKCPNQAISVSGICVACPSNCKSCQIDQTKNSLLSCLECSQKYSGPSCSVSDSKCTQIPNCAYCSRDFSGQQTCNQCSPLYALNFDQKTCSFKCPTFEVLVFDSNGQTYCQKALTGNSEDYIGGVYSGTPYLLRKAGTCPQGYRILRQKCVQSCPDGTDINAERRCICRPGFATLSNETCLKITQVIDKQLGLYYNSTYNTFLSCPIGCLSCQSDTCLQCYSGHILVVTSTSSVCRQESLHFSCNSQSYVYDIVNRVCMANSVAKVASNITNCKTEYRRRCIVCKPGFYMFQASCVSNCDAGYSKVSGRCIKSLSNCQIPEIRSTPVKTVINSSILSSPAYQIYSSNLAEISNDPFTEILAVRDQLGIPTNTPMTATFYKSELVCKVKSGQPIPPPPTNTTSDSCADKQKPYLLLNGSCVNQCPVKTYLYISDSNKSPLCLTFTSCYDKNKTTPFQLADGSCAASCPAGTVPTQFGNGSTVQCSSLTECQKINKMTPFQLPNTQCSSACPPGTAPELQNGVNLKCLTLNTTRVAPKIHIDSSVFDIGQEGGEKRRIFFFVVDRVLNLSDINVNYYKYDTNRPTPMVSQSKLYQQLSSNNVDLTQFNDKTYLAINSVADQVVLDLSKNIKQFSTEDGNRLASSIYGVRASQNRIQNTRSWLAIIAYVLSLILIILHSIYIGNQLLYKVDNFLIFAQSLYFFSFVHLLINNSIGQFYYGFLWSHFGFFPNYFRPTIPQNYMEGFSQGKDQNGNYLPNSYRLLTGDANFIRNAGFSFSLLCTFVAAYLVIVLVVLIMRRCCGKYEVWHRRIAKQALIAAFEFVAMNIFYWAVAHLLCNRNTLFSGVAGQPGQHVAYRTSCSAAAIAWICIYGVYMILRFVKNKIGGLYMFKRLAFAVILAASAYHNNGDNRYKLFLIALVAAELLFMILRFVLEKPYLKRQKVFIILETVLMLAAYFTIYLWNDTGFVSIFVSLILFLFIFLFTQDLMDVYLDNRDQYYNDNVKLMPGLRQKQFQNGNEYQKLNVGASLPESDRRLRSQ